MRFILFLSPILMLAACGQGQTAQESSDGATDSKSNSDGGNLRIATDKDGGTLQIAAKGVNIDLDMPDLETLNIQSDFDIDGVKLYPGSQITALDINARDQNPAKDAVVTFDFTSPVAPAAAADWMAAELAKKSIKVARRGDRLTGVDADGNAFKIQFAPDGATTAGEIQIVSK